MSTLDALRNLLACAEDQLETPVCRSFINPGDNAPHDVCDGELIDGVLHSGQLWVANTVTTAGWPAPTGNPITCATPFADVIELGIVRCQASTLTDTANIPEADTITQDAEQQLTDKDALKAAILCCWDVEGMDMADLLWEPIDPLGGCVGGTWTFIYRDASCSCPGES